MVLQQKGFRMRFRRVVVRFLVSVPVLVGALLSVVDTEPAGLTWALRVWSRPSRCPS